MSHPKHGSRGGTQLSQAMPGYKGYAGAKVAHRTDRIFSERILSRLSDAVATSSRIRRHAGTDLGADMISSLAAIEEKAESLAQTVAETAFDDSVGTPEHGAGGQVVSLDSSILEKLGSINQALSTMDLEGGTGVSDDEMESICDLLDDIRNLIKRRASMLNGR